MTAVEIKGKLETNDKWLVRGLLAIYENQTTDEQDAEATVENNGVGFTGYDAELLSSFAKQIIRWQDGLSQYDSPLSPRQLEIARKRMVKYAGQLAGIAAARATA